jgi:hypothetical protein
VDGNGIAAPLQFVNDGICEVRRLGGSALARYLYASRAAIHRGFSGTPTPDGIER